MVNTKKVADRRSLHFESLDDILTDVERLGEGEIRTSGNWTPAQNVQHVGRLIGFSVDGFPFRAPWYLRLVGPLFKRQALSKPPPPGFGLGGQLEALVPDPDVTWDQALDELRATIQKAKRDGMSEPSPILGRMTHDEWVRLHCRHAELHFSFLHPAG
jgi:hypothetical protein